jgi:hypothetical protein
MTGPRNDGHPLATAGGGAPTPSPRTQGGTWYFVLTILTGGFLAAVPFWHAANRLGRPEVRRLAAIYTVADAYLVMLMILTPPTKPDGSSGNSAISTLGGFSVLMIVVVACIQLRSLRREVYGGGAVRSSAGDPLIARALAARARRAEARKLSAQDPALGRELGIGRPDLGRGYDDGGLVDLNSAPAEVIARVCDIERPCADAIVAGREARGGTYFNLGELLVDLPLPPHIQEQLQERAIF